MDWQFGAICALFLYSVAITTLHVRRSRRFAYRASQFKRRRHVSTTVAKNDDETEIFDQYKIPRTGLFLYIFSKDLFGKNRWILFRRKLPSGWVTLLGGEKNVQFKKKTVI